MVMDYVRAVTLMYVTGLMPDLFLFMFFFFLFVSLLTYICFCSS